MRDAGMEVIFAGYWLTPAAVAKIAIEEDADIIGLSCYSREYWLIPQLLDDLRKNGSNIPVIVGGVIPPEDARTLVGGGVAAVFPPGSYMSSIVEGVKEIALKPRHG